MAVFASRQIVLPATPITVTITGSGNSSNCYAIINGTKQYSAGTHEVYTGDTITFGVHGYPSTFYGEVNIDGTRVLKVTTQSTKTYEWTVPSGTISITIAMSYTIEGQTRYGRITVTTA